MGPVESSTTSQYWIYKTTDGAKTWQQQLAAENSDRSNTYGFFDRIKPFQFFNRTRGLAFVRGRDVYSTNDAGRHWTKVNLPPYNIDSLTFFVFRDSAFTSPDGGRTWHPQPLPPGSSYRNCAHWTYANVPAAN